MKLEYYTCDRCGKEMKDPYDVAFEFGPDGSEMKHLCQDCKKVLNELNEEYLDKLRAFYNANKK